MHRLIVNRISVIYVFIVMLCHNGYGQARVVFNNGYMKIDMGAFLVIDNPNANAIVNSAAGNIITESEMNLVKWNIGENSGNYVVPFATTGLVKIPLEVNLGTLASGPGGFFLFSTFPTVNDDNTAYASDVTHMNSQCNSGNGLSAVDRFWRIEASAYTVKPSGILLFTYNNSPAEIAGTNTLAESRLQAERFNSILNSWETPSRLYGQANPLVRQVANIQVSGTDFHRSWTLIDTLSMAVSKTRNVSICQGQSVFLQGAQQTTSGIYYDTLNVAGNCDTTYMTQLTVNALPSGPVILSDTLSITCNAPVVTATLAAVTASTSITWSPLSGIVPGTAYTAAPSFTAPGTYSVTFTNTLTGCQSGGTDRLVVLQDVAPPTFTFTNNGTLSGTITCSNPSVVINPVFSPSIALSYTWMPGGVISPSLSSVTFTAPGSYTLNVTNTLNGCVSSATPSSIFTIYKDTITPSVTVAAVSGNTTIGCGGSGNITVSLEAVATGNSLNYMWLPGGITTPTLTVASAGVYTVIATNAVNSCSSTAVYSVTGNTVPPQGVSVVSDTVIPCGASAIMLQGTTTSTNPVFYRWTTDLSSAIVSGANTSTPFINAAGIYTLTVTDSTNYCTSTVTVAVSQATVQAAFVATPSVGVAPLDVSFTNTSFGASTYQWQFGNGTGSNISNPFAQYTESGTYTVVLTVTSASCIATATTVVIVYDDLFVEIPNVFTPNSDGVNDAFLIRTKGIKEIDLKIFNRWGQLLYEFTGPLAAWDGRMADGAEASDGTYFYMVSATGYEDRKITREGTVTLFR